MAQDNKKVVKRRKKKTQEFHLLEGRGQIHVKATYNNTIVTLSLIHI